MKRSIFLGINLLFVFVLLSFGVSAGEIIEAKCVNPKQKEFLFHIDSDGGKQKIAGLGESKVKFSKKNIIVNSKRGTVVFDLSNGKVYFNGEHHGAICKYDNLAAIKLSPTSSKTPSKNDVQIQPKASVNSITFDSNLVFEMPFSDFFNKKHNTANGDELFFEKVKYEVGENREDGLFKFEIEVHFNPKINVRGSKWEAFIAILRKSTGNAQYLVFACSTRPQRMKHGRDRNCKEDDVLYKSENPFLPNDRVMVTLGINKHER